MNMVVFILSESLPVSFTTIQNCAKIFLTQNKQAYVMIMWYTLSVTFER